MHVGKEDDTELMIFSEAEQTIADLPDCVPVTDAADVFDEVRNAQDDYRSRLLWLMIDIGDQPPRDAESERRKLDRGLFILSHLLDQVIPFAAVEMANEAFQKPDNHPTQ